MNKNYLPYYNSLKERDKIFWLGQDKETLIDHIISNINNGEILLSRIEQAKEYIEAIVKNTPSSMRKDYANMLLIDYKKLLEILDGER